MVFLRFVLLCQLDVSILIGLANMHVECSCKGCIEGSHLYHAKELTCQTNVIGVDGSAYGGCKTKEAYIRMLQLPPSGVQIEHNESK